MPRQQPHGSLSPAFLRAPGRRLDSMWTLRPARYVFSHTLRSSSVWLLFDHPILSAGLLYHQDKVGTCLRSDLCNPSFNTLMTPAFSIHSIEKNHRVAKCEVARPNLIDVAKGWTAASASFRPDLTCSAADGHRQAVVRLNSSNRASVKDGKKRSCNVRVEAVLVHGCRPRRA